MGKMGNIELYIRVVNNRHTFHKLSFFDFVSFIRTNRTDIPYVTVCKEHKDKSAKRAYYVLKVVDSPWTFKCTREQLKSLFQKGIIRSHEFKFTADGRLIRNVSGVAAGITVTVAKPSAKKPTLSLPEQINKYYNTLEGRCKAAQLPFERDVISITDNGEVVLEQANTIIKGVYYVPPFVTTLRSVQRGDKGIFPETIVSLRVVNKGTKLHTAKAMFKYCSALESLDLTEFDTSNITDMSQMFFDCNNLKELKLPLWDVSNVVDMSYMFAYCNHLKEAKFQGWDVRNVKDMSFMFGDCNDLQTVEVASWDTSSVKDMRGMFTITNGRGDNLTALGIGTWDVSSVICFSCMFAGRSKLQSLDLRTWNVSRAQYMGNMFLNCCGLKTLDIGDWDVLNVTDMEYMFSGCTELQSLDIGAWNVLAVHNMRAMFNRCKALRKLNINAWKVTDRTYMRLMFNGCALLDMQALPEWYTEE